MCLVSLGKKTTVYVLAISDTSTKSGISWLPPNWVKLATNGTNLGLFKISYSTFWLFKAIRITRGKSPPFDNNYQKMKSNNSCFRHNLESGISLSLFYQNMISKVNCCVIQIPGQHVPCVHGYMFQTAHSKSNNYLGFKEEYEREIIACFCQNTIWSYLFTYILIDKTKTNQNECLFSNKIEICHCYTGHTHTQIQIMPNLDIT